MRPRYRLVRSVSSALFRSALGVFGVVQVRLVRSGVPQRLVLFAWMRPGGRWVSVGSSGSSWCAQRFVVFF